MRSTGSHDGEVGHVPESQRTARDDHLNRQEKRNGRFEFVVHGSTPHAATQSVSAVPKHVTLSTAVLLAAMLAGAAAPMKCQLGKVKFLALESQRIFTLTVFPAALLDVVNVTLPVKERVLNPFPSKSMSVVAA